MEYLAVLAIGFCGGLAFGMHIAGAMLDNIRRDLARLEQQQHARDDELAEDFA